MTRYHRISLGIIAAGHGGGRPALMEERHLDFMEEKMRGNRELSGPELQAMLLATFNLQVSSDTILRCRRRLGWRYGATRLVNK